MSETRYLFDMGKSGDLKTENSWIERAREIFYLFCSKHHDYGPNNIAAMGTDGIISMLKSKVERLDRLHNQKVDPNNETLRDTVLDIADYGIILLLVMDGEWPKKTKQTWAEAFDELTAAYSKLLDEAGGNIAKERLEKLIASANEWLTEITWKS